MMQELQVHSEIEAKLQQFIAERFLKGQSPAVTVNDSLLDGNLMDSMGILDIVDFVEAEFSITVEGEELLPENFQTIAVLAAFINSKLA
jgi:acyl carrier protein